MALDADHVVGGKALVILGHTVRDRQVNSDELMTGQSLCGDPRTTQSTPAQDRIGHQRLFDGNAIVLG